MYDIIAIADPRAEERLIEESASPDLTCAQLKCEMQWKKDHPAYAKKSEISWDGGVMYYTYEPTEQPPAFRDGRKLTRKCQYQLREVALCDEPEPGLYEVYNTKNGSVLTAAVPANRAHWECERAWRTQYPSLAKQSDLCWRDGVLRWRHCDGEPFDNASVQIRRMSTPDPKDLKSIEYATLTGKRTYQFDVFNDRMHAAAYTLIQEHNRNVEFWMEMADRNRTAPEGKENQVTVDWALWTNGKMDGLHTAIDAILRALGML